jgi:hypothetical protein
VTTLAERATELGRFLAQFETALQRESYLHFGRILPRAGSGSGGGEPTTTTVPADDTTTTTVGPAVTAGTAATEATAAAAVFAAVAAQAVEEEDEFKPPPLFSSATPQTALAHAVVALGLRRIFPGLSEGAASDLVNRWAYRFTLANSPIPALGVTSDWATGLPIQPGSQVPGTGEGGAAFTAALEAGQPAWAWPSISDALQDPWLLAAASKIPTGAALLPPAFRVKEIDGRITLWDNTLASGPRPVGVGGGYYDPNIGTFRQPGDFELTRETPVGEPRPQYAGGGQRTWNPETEQWETTPVEITGTTQEYATVPTGQAWGMTMAEVMGLPIYDRNMLNSFFAMMTEPTNPRSPGSYGSGRTIRFDRDEIIEAINTAWQGWLLAKPADPGSLADQYIAAATSFYYQGGDLDFETWVKNKMRETGRYLDLYRQKPEYMTEDEYMGGYRQTAEQYGLRPLTTKTETEIGAQSGVSLTDFAARLAGTSEFMTSNQGQFSKAFASMLGGLGAVGRS